MGCESMSSSIVSGRDEMRVKHGLEEREDEKRPLLSWSPAEKNWPKRKWDSAAFHKWLKKLVFILSYHRKQLYIFKIAWWRLFSRGASAKWGDISLMLDLKNYRLIYYKSLMAVERLIILSWNCKIDLRRNWRRT